MMDAENDERPFGVAGELLVARPPEPQFTPQPKGTPPRHRLLPTGNGSARRPRRAAENCSGSSANG